MKLSLLAKESLNHTTTLLFIGGFIFDLIILPEAGHTVTIVLGVIYLSIVAVAIAVREWVISLNAASKNERRIFSVLTFAIAYFSGSALSFISVYAIRSAAFAVSWPILLLLFLCILVNEFVASHHFRFALDVGVLFLAVLFFVIFNLPIFLKVQNDMTFVFSAGITVLVSLLYIYALSFTSESAADESPRLYALAVGIPMFMGMLYFLNVIPAVPLSLGNAGVYHNIVRDNVGEFSAVKEIDSRMFTSLRVPLYHLGANDKGVYFFSSVSAPGKLTAPISHTWEYYDPVSKKWKEMTTVAFTLAGGREDGYRAYSQKENVTDGLWRVTVKVDSKRIVGRMKFYIAKDEAKEKELVTVKL